MALSFYADFYPAMRRALDEGGGLSPADAEGLVGLAARVLPEHRGVAEDHIRALQNTAGDAGARAVFEAFLGGAGRAGRDSGPGDVGRSPRTRRPARPTRTIGRPRPAGGAFPPGVVGHGGTRGAPPWFGEGLRLSEIVHDFGGGNGVYGTGAHLGGGFVLTAGHVAAQWLPADARYAEAAYAGDAPFLEEWQVCFLPAKSGYPGSAHPQFFDRHRGAWDDYAVLHAPEKVGTQAVRGFRPVSSLQPGERLWVVGDKTRETLRVSEGVFRAREGNNAVVEDIEIEGGFSGSPVTDDDGNVVGVCSVRLNGGDMLMVNIEAIAAQVRAHAPGSELAARLAPALS